MCVSSVAHSCPVLWDSLDCSPPGIFVRGILQASIQEWVAISPSRGSAWLSDWTHGTCIGRRVGRHLGKSLGALTALGNSVVMRSLVRKPGGQSSLCAVPRLSLLGVWESSLTNPQEAFKPWWGLWAQGHEPLPSAVSLFPLMSWCQWSSWVHSLSGIFRAFPGGSQGNCPAPSSETMLSPRAQGVFFSTSPESSLQTGRRHPPLDQGLQLFSFWVIFTYFT